MPGQVGPTLVMGFSEAGLSMATCPPKVRHILGKETRDPQG